MLGLHHGPRTATPQKAPFTEEETEAERGWEPPGEEQGLEQNKKASKKETQGPTSLQGQVH